MDLYHVVLYLHIITLMVAASVTAITKLAAARRVKARTVGEALEWHNILMSASKIFPICLALFVITGFYMIGVSKLSPSTGFIVGGIAGVVLLLSSGVFLATKGKVLKARLEGMAKNGADQPMPKAAPRRVVVVLPIVNTGIALSVAFDMVTKPTSIPVALAVIAVGIVVSGALAMRGSAPAPEEAYAS